jgi:hypothetical protein
MQQTRPSKSSEPGDERLFHPKHLIGLFWSLIAAILAFFAGQVYSSREGPQKVYVTNVDTARRVIAIGDSSAREYLRDIAKEVRALRQAQALVGISATPIRQSADTAGVQPTATPELPPNSPQIPPFEFPSNVAGHITGALGAFASSRCPAPNQLAGADLSTELLLRSPALVERITPLVLQVSTPVVHNTINQVFEQQYEARVRNRLLFTLPQTPGEYVLEFGFYLRSELSKKYPTYYRAVCRISLH